MAQPGIVQNQIGLGFHVSLLVFWDAFPKIHIESVDGEKKNGTAKYQERAVQRVFMKPHVNVIIKSK